MSQVSAQFAVLVDNNADPGLVAEHGFALWVEVEGRHILFDTGQRKALALNADAMGCDLKQVDTLVLSHGHYDHTGAVSEMLHLNPTARVYCHAKALDTRYSLHPGKSPRDISMPPSAREAIHELPRDRVHWLTGHVEICDGIGIAGPIPRKHPMEDTGGPFYLDIAGLHPDHLQDDTAMWLKTSKGLVIITGCCHSGLINTVEYIRHITGEGKVMGIIGGLHLQSAKEERLENTCCAMQEWNPEFVFPCHCTGSEAITSLRRRMGQRVVIGYAGLNWQV
jgi:7,8-dihydropterin-6-yl-methyl-4-(beta-D-ribofuranosyl)aminobenzene 5'-phosphate synthase